MNADDKVLLIDDDANLLSALRRQLHGRYALMTADSGARALETLEQDPSIAVVVCDMRMPGMTGVETLEAFAKRAPTTTRIMLTGNADQDCAVEAVNKGHIYRFLNKPCATEDLCLAIDAGLRQHHLIAAEKKLLETTLAGSIKLLSDVVSLMDPMAAGNARKVAGWAARLAPHIAGVSAWELNFAAMLAPLGRVAVPAELTLRQASDKDLTDEEKNILRTVPEVGGSLVANIPRMEGVARGILYQDKHFDGGGFPEDDVTGPSIPLAGRILHLLKAIAEATDGHEPGPTVFDALAKKEGRFDPDILNLARRHLSLRPGETAEDGSKRSEHVAVFMLRPGHELVADLEYQNGGLVLVKGTVLSAPQIARLRSLSQVHKVKEPIQVALPAA